MDTNENIIDKFKYIGLDLNKIPDVIKDFKPLDYRPSKYNDEHVYKVYKYINVNDIQIMLTPCNRLSDITQKYSKAVPLYEYLIQDKEENIEKHTKFLSMISNIDIEKIEEIEEEQKRLNKKIPFMVKYPKDYLWQIYYSEYTDKYFMLVPIEDQEYFAFFYLLKKQLKKRKTKNDLIFVPISYTDYSGDYLTRLEITDIKNYLWLFTKEWPLVYEVYDKDNNLSIEITGKTNIYDDIQSEYKIKLDSKEDALKLYKLLKALFIIQTEVPHHYAIKLLIDNLGGIDFYINKKKVIYEILPSVIKEEYLKAEELKINLGEEKTSKEKELDSLQKKSAKLEKEFLEKERQISTFLECKKTFIGRVKYFFKFKKVNLTKQNKKKEKEQEVKVVRLNKYSDVKSNYTLEELIELYKQIDKEDIKVKNLELDIKAINQRINNLESKVKNATLFIEEIDKHKKSIFEFWRFTNKDKVSELTAGKIVEENKEKIKKVFDYELDFEDLSKELDKLQRDNLSKEELNSIFLTTTNNLKDINKVRNKEELDEKEFNLLKKEIEDESTLLNEENFDIFGGMAYDNKLKILANQKHREVEREKFRILDINKKTTIDEYKEYLEDVVNNLDTAFRKIKLPVDLSVYKADEEGLNDGFNRFSIEGKTAILKLIDKDIKEFNIYKLNLKENTAILPYTNIVYFENNNKTLPLGMNVSEGILIDKKSLNLKLKSKEELRLVSYKDPNDHLSDISIRTINIEEYDIEEKKIKKEVKKKEENKEGKED